MARSRTGSKGRIPFVVATSSSVIVVVVVCRLSQGARGRVQGAAGESRSSSLRRLPAASSLTIVSSVPMRAKSKTGSGGRIPFVLRCRFLAASLSSCVCAWSIRIRTGRRQTFPKRQSNTVNLLSLIFWAPLIRTRSPERAIMDADYDNVCPNHQDDVVDCNDDNGIPHKHRIRRTTLRTQRQRGRGGARARRRRNNDYRVCATTVGIDATNTNANVIKHCHRRRPSTDDDDDAGVSECCHRQSF